MSVNIKQNGNLTKVANNISIVQANWNDKDNTSKNTCIKNQPETLKTLEEISANTDENALAGANAVKELNSSLESLIKSFDYSGTTNSNGAILIGNIPSDFGCFITATHNHGGYYGVIPSVINGTFKSLIFKGSDNGSMSNVSVSGKIYYVSK